MKTIFHSPLILFLLLILSFNVSLIISQPAANPFFISNNSTQSLDDNSDNNNNNNDLYTNPKFSPSVAIIVVILVAVLFFMAFFSMYIRHCSDNTDLGRGNSVRNGRLAVAQRDRILGGGVGLETSVIETFPMFSYSEVRDHKIGKGALECAVCLNEFEDDETLRFIPKCDHVFHPECIHVWLENHVTCPVCRCNLTPQAGDEPYRLPELDQENNDIAIQVEDEFEGQVEAKPEVNRVWSSFKYSNRPPRSQSVKAGCGRNGFGLGKFRSHSTGHLIQPGENVDPFTLRLPEELRKQMMNRALLNRAKSVDVHLPRDGSSTTRRWFRTGLGEGSMKGTSSLTKVNEPDRWLFFTRKVSIKSAKVTAENGEATTPPTIETTQSFNIDEPKNIDEKSLLHSEPVQLSV